MRDIASRFRMNSDPSSLSLLFSIGKVEIEKGKRPFPAVKTRLWRTRRRAIKAGTRLAENNARVELCGRVSLCSASRRISTSSQFSLGVALSFFLPTDTLLSGPFLPPRKRSIMKRTRALTCSLAREQVHSGRPYRWPNPVAIQFERTERLMDYYWILLAAFR